MHACRGLVLLLRFTLTYPYPDTVLGFIIITNYQKVKKNISRMVRFLSKTSRTRSIPPCGAESLRYACRCILN